MQHDLFQEHLATITSGFINMMMRIIHLPRFSMKPFGVNVAFGPQPLKGGRPRNIYCKVTVLAQQRLLSIFFTIKLSQGEGA